MVKMKMMRSVEVKLGQYEQYYRDDSIVPSNESSQSQCDEKKKDQFQLIISISWLLRAPLQLIEWASFSFSSHFKHKTTNNHIHKSHLCFHITVQWSDHHDHTPPLTIARAQPDSALPHLLFFATSSWIQMYYLLEYPWVFSSALLLMLSTTATLQHPTSLNSLRLIFDKQLYHSIPDPMTLSLAKVIGLCNSSTNQQNTPTTPSNQHNPHKNWVTHLFWSRCWWQLSSTIQAIVSVVLVTDSVDAVTRKRNIATLASHPAHDIPTFPSTTWYAHSP